MGEQPTANESFGEPRAFLARRSCGKVAKPGEALQLLCQRFGGADAPKVEVLEREGLGADREPTRK